MALRAPAAGCIPSAHVLDSVDLEDTMYGLTAAIASLLAFPFLFPEEFITLSRRIRRWLKEDVRRRVSDSEWERIKHEYDDLG